MKFIQLSGIGRAGKTTLANYIANVAASENYIPVIIPFAKALKDAVAADGITKETHPDIYRARCQQKGAELRAKNPAHFIDEVKEEVEDLKETELFLRNHASTQWEHIVIQDDVRYMNELAYGRDVGAYQVFVTPSTRTIPELLDAWRDHESETLCNEVEIGNLQYTDLFHEYIVNSGTIEELKGKVAKRFFSWVTEPDHSFDSVSVQYRAGGVPSDQFILRLLIKASDSSPMDVDIFLETLEDLEWKRDEEAEDSDT
jgi:hypothetical protein